MPGWWSQGPFRRYGAAALLVAAAVAGRLALEPWLQGRFPFLAVLVAVGITAWHIGPWPAALAAVFGFWGMHEGLPSSVQAWFGGPTHWTVIGYALSAGVLVGTGAVQQHTRRRQADERRERLASEQALQRSESLLRGLYDSTRLCMGVVELTDDGDILHLQDNGRTCRLFNVPPGGTANRRASQLGATAEKIVQWRDHYVESARRQQPVDFSYFQQHADGQHWYAVTVAPLPQVAGERQRFSYIIDDATDRRATALHQRQSATQARLALDIAEIGTWSWDPARDVLRADRRCRELCGLSADMRLYWRDLIASLHVDDREGFEHDVLFAQAPRGSGTYTRELRLVQPDGSVRWAVIRGQMLLLPDDDGAGQHTILLNTMLDITSRKRGEHALAESDRRKNEFIATLSHELRNPLAPLRTGVAMLRRAGADAAVRERVTTTMERQLGHMVRMIDDLLDVSRITRDQLQLRRQPVTMVQVMTAALETAQPLIEGRAHALQVCPADPAGCGVFVEGDPARLTQVLANLLNNAAKYTPSGGHIELALQADEREVRLSVTDSGIGIAPALLPRVFDMFAQVDQDARASQGGLGIGLAISRRLMEMHGGRIEADSAGPGQGSRFTMVLPRLAEVPRPAAPPRVTHTDHRAASRRILVVDDNVDAAQTLCELLRLEGHDARAVHDGAAALQMAAQWPPDIALLDIGMPQMDGYELAGHLAAQGGAQTPLLVAVTGWGQQADRQRSADAGFDDHLVKPVDPVALLQLIDSLPLTRVELL